jgi:solute carrier family 10 (sodium/bile acid cotransporter), member 7
MTTMPRLTQFLPDRFTTALLGTVVLATFLPGHGIVADIVEMLARTAICLLFFLHGARLPRAAALEGLGHWRLHLMVFALSFVVFPLLGLALHAALLGVLGPVLALGILFLTTLPSTVQASIAFTAIARGNVAAAVCSAAASNLFGIFITPALIALLAGASGETWSAGTVASLVEQLVLPFLAGQLLHTRLGPWLARNKAPMAIVDRGSILLVVYSAFSAAVLGGLWQQLPAAKLVLLLAVNIGLLAAIMGIAVLGSRLFGFSREDEIAILFCGSKKSLVSGLPLASILFPAASVGVLVVPLMLFHQVQLIACAVLARRYAEAGNTGAADAVPAE